MTALRRLGARPGFVASPRTVVPILIVITVLLAVASILSGSVSSQKVYATVVAGSAIIIFFGLVVVISRLRRPRES